MSEARQYACQISARKLFVVLEQDSSILIEHSEFAADIMSMFSFTKPFGFVRNSRDERLILAKWRQGLNV